MSTSKMVLLLKLPVYIIFVILMTSELSMASTLRLGTETYDFSQFGEDIKPEKVFSKSISGHKIQVQYILKVAPNRNRCGNKPLYVTWTWNGDYAAKQPTIGFEYILTPLERRVFYTIDFPKKERDSAAAFRNLFSQDMKYTFGSIAILNFNEFLVNRDLVGKRSDERFLALHGGRVLALLKITGNKNSKLVEIDLNNPDHNFTLAINFPDLPPTREGLSCALQTASELSDAIENVRNH